MKLHKYLKNKAIVLLMGIFMLASQLVYSQEIKIEEVKADSFPVIQLRLSGVSEVANLSLEQDGKSVDKELKFVAKKNGIWLQYTTFSKRDGSTHDIELKTQSGAILKSQFEAPNPFYTLYDFLKMLGSLGLFLFGMKIMSEGIQKTAGLKLRNILGYMTQNRVVAVLTGFSVTAIVQSSSATSVMIVSFTNAGFFNLSQSIGLIMGANIGTTVTGWIISILGLKVSLATYSLPILAIAMPFLFFAGERTRNWAEFFIGFALLFMGLNELKMSVPDIKNNPEILHFLESWSKWGNGSLVVFIIIGTLLTIIVQASTASLALTLVLLNNGWIDFSTAAALILGENIGTTVTAQIAALIANVDGKRAAMAHSLFNLVGILWMVLIFHPYLHFVNWLVSNISVFFCDLNPNSSSLCGTNIDFFTTDRTRLAEIGPVGLSAFHTTFNIINTLLLIGFIKQIEQVVKRIIPSKSKIEDASSLRFINQGVMATPEFALIEASKEIKEFGNLTFKMFRYVQMMCFRTPEKHKKILKRLNQYEEECDLEELEIAQFLAKLSMQNLSSHANRQIKSMWTAISELERIGDLCFRLGQIVERKIKLKYQLTESSEKGLEELFNLIEQSFDAMLKNLGTENGGVVAMAEISELEQKINDKRSELRNTEFILIESSDGPFQRGLLTIEIISNLEKIGDHIYNVNQANAGLK